MGALAPLNLLVVFGSQLPAKSFAEDVKGNVMEAPCTPTSDNRRGSCGARRRRPVALPAVDVMASFCMLSHGCYGPLEVSTQGMMDNFSHCGDPTGEGRHPDDAGLMNPTYPKEPPILLSPPTPSKPSKPKQVNPELEKMCQEAFSDMVLLPRSAVDLNLKLKWRPSKEEVSKIILELTRDNVAALAVIATLSMFGLIYLWKICTRKSCSCKLCRNQYRTLDLLGAGGYGSVYLVERLPDLERYVSKKIPVREITEVDEYSREAKELVLLRHKHIVFYEEDFVHIEYGGFEPKTYFIIVMEYCPAGDLKEKIELDFLSFTEEWIRTIFAQLLQAVQYLHSKNVIHRDLKSQNVFLAESGRVRLGDFGLCRHAPRNVETSPTLTHAGTDCYMSPEMLSSSRYGKPADIWSLGCILYELCTGQFMWELDGILGAMVMKDAHAVQKLMQAEIAPAVGTELKTLLRRLLSVNPASRPTATACIRRKIFKKGYQLSTQSFGESLGEEVEAPVCNVDAESPEVLEGGVDPSSDDSDQEEGEEELAESETNCCRETRYADIAPPRRRRRAKRGRKS